MCVVLMQILQLIRVRLISAPCEFVLYKYILNFIVLFWYSNSFGDMCSTDQSDIYSASGFFVANECLVLPDFTQIGAPAYINSGIRTDCGAVTHFYTDSNCRDLNLTMYSTNDYFCHNVNNSGAADFPNAATGGAASSQNFCNVKDANGHRAPAKPAPGDKPNGPNPFGDKGKGRAKAFEESIDMDSLFQQYSEQATVSSSGIGEYTYAVVGGVLCFVGVMVGKFYKQKSSEFEPVPVNSLHSAI